MKVFKRLLALLLAILVITACVPGTAAAAGKTAAVTGGDRVSGLSAQLETLYRRVGEELNIDYLWVKILHLIAGGTAVYADTIPDVYTDVTVSALKGPFEIDGAAQDYDRRAPWVNGEVTEAERSSGRYLPDAAYNVAADVVAIVNARLTADRGTVQGYFDALELGTKRRVLFCEAVLQYMGKPEAANGVLAAYLSMMDAKQQGENVLVSSGSGIVFKDEYAVILSRYGISDGEAQRALATILSFDKMLAVSSGAEAVLTCTVLPYEIGYTSRDNMMLAAMSIVGKCRYVWGGGHTTTGLIKGINPVWKIFSDSYGDEKGEAGYDKCIEPNDSWCPLHGKKKASEGCLYYSWTVSSAQRYIEERASKLDLSSVDLEELTTLLESSVDFERGITSHRLDGLDCSGYTSWLYNQVSSGKYSYDAGGLGFIGQGGVKRLKTNEKLQPGDVFSWGAHIVVIVAPVSEGSRAYVILECGPNNVKFGVAYYGNAKTADINAAHNVAKEANALLGGLPEGELTSKYSMNLRYKSSDYWNGYRAWGRLRGTFEDQDTVIEAYGRTISELTAQELIQYTLEHMPFRYITGLDEYDGELFDVTAIRNSMTQAETAEPDMERIVLNAELRGN